MKKCYLVKVDKQDIRSTEKTLLNYLIDRMYLCSLIKLVYLKDDEKHVYFVIWGEQYSCRVVLSMTKKVLQSKDIQVKIFSYDSLKSADLYNLIWIVAENSLGGTLKRYQNNPLIINYINQMTTNYILKKGLLSNHLFCADKKCEGVADPVALSSLKGVYKCSSCGREREIEGPLISGNKPVSHLTEEEQLYLIGIISLDSLSIKEDNMIPEPDYIEELADNNLTARIEVSEVESHSVVAEHVININAAALEILQGEQIAMPWSDNQDVEAPVRMRRRRRSTFVILNSTELTRAEIEQISWDIAQ